MERKMTEQELISSLDEAIENGHIFVYYQPKVNHATGRMIGAEALMRWKHPEYGIQYPSDFIPVLEKHDLLYLADIAVFESACRFLRSRLDKGLHCIIISCNMSRHDILHSDYIDRIEKIREKYDIPVKLLHIEITESSAVGGMELVSETLHKLHDLGYKVEMDDFGSGYSSLNVLKDLPVDVIKLDMRFFSGNLSGRGGTIINAVVQMAKWLDTPVIAEGVEKIEQADYMKSIGCTYIQGYLYSKPLSAEDFSKKIEEFESEPMMPAIVLDKMNADKFWNPDSLETLIFNNYVGGAAIFSYTHGKIELLRVNNKYTKELGMCMSEQEILKCDPWSTMDIENHKIYESTLQKAIKSNDEENCEVWRKLCSKICGDDLMCIRSFIRLLGKAGDEYLFYEMVQNITGEKRAYNEMALSEKRFYYAGEHNKVFAWEYEIATKKMRPCSRCRRELALPEVLENYPEPMIESHLFPPEIADEYRDWHRQLAEGVPYLEKIFYLTDDRVPFYVRYTNEFDENGKPLKAYASATPVIENE